MSICRFCLAQKPRKNITELQVSNDSGNKKYQEIIMFCLGIQIDEDSNITTDLCVKCFRNTIEFHHFKSKVLKSEVYLKSIGPFLPPLDCKTQVHGESKPKTEVTLTHNIIKTETIESVDIGGFDNSDCIDNNDCLESNECEVESKIETELEIKAEPKAENGSDDEFLSVIKKIKYEYIEESIENCESIEKKIKCRTKRTKKVKTPKCSRRELKIGPMKICDACGKYVRDLKSHKMTHLPLEERRRYKCELCDKTFASLHSKSKHKNRKHYAKKKECPECHKLVANLSVHMKMHNPEELKYECAVCGRRFVSKSRLELHVTIHTKDRPFDCPICHKKFRLKLSMSMHVRQVHEKEKTHLCQYCSKSFFKKHHLQLHLRSHTKEKPYECTICGKFFGSTTILNSHIQIHSTDKKYACSLCDMTFVKLSYLSTHMISHTKEKRYPCQFCEVRFHRSDHRKRHEFTAHLKHSTATPA